MSSATARTCATITSGGIGWIAVTPTVFWAVIAVIAVIPWTPQAANAFRSAWMPAPPPESEPAIERTRGMRGARGSRWRVHTDTVPATQRAIRDGCTRPLRNDGEPAACAAPHEPRELELGKRRQPLVGGNPARASAAAVA